MRRGFEGVRAFAAGSCLVAAVLAPHRGDAATLWLEAESVRERVSGVVTAPMLIKDDAAASSGSYLEVAAGNNSSTAMNAGEGYAAYTFTVETAGTFRIWARVIAPSDADDSFWVKMDAGTPIRWNGIPLGGAWHWTQVKAEGASSPSQFALGAGDHVLKIGYREDGTRLDALVVTDDLTYDPTAPIAGAPEAPQLTSMEWPTLSGVSLSWAAVRGAQSYTVTREDVVVASLPGHRFRQAGTDYACYKVYAVGPTGTSLPADECTGSYGTQRRIYVSDMSWTAPIENGDPGLGAKAGTPDALAAPAAHGRAQLDFGTASATKMKIWASGTAPSADQDSFWVRLDNGPWIKWNNIPAPFNCNVVHNSDAGGAPVVFNFAAGSHRFEIANRETGTSFWKLFFTEDLEAGPNCHD